MIVRDEALSLMEGRGVILDTGREVSAMLAMRGSRRP